MNNKTLIWACLAGTAIEWFDFSLFGILSSIIATLFFPNEALSISLINTFTVYATGFLMRPIGALFWGYKADMTGRKKVIIATIALMTFSTVAIGLLPSFSTLGIAASVILVFLRLIQGLSASGEQASMLTYLYEIAPLGQKKILSSISYVGVFFGMALAMLLCLIIHLNMNENNFVSWGWRIPFISSILLGYIGYSLRIKMLESKPFQSYYRTKKDSSWSEWSKSITTNITSLAASIGIFQLAITAPYIAFVYSVVYSIKTHLLNSEAVYLSTFFSLFLTSFLVYLFAKIAEKSKINFRLISILGILVGSILIYPWFLTSNIELYAIAQIYFGSFTAMLIGPFCSDLVKIFNIGTRCTSTGICINLSAAVFGGLTPVILSAFQLTKSPIAYSIAFILTTCLVALASEPIFKRYMTGAELEQTDDRSS